MFGIVRSALDLHCLNQLDCGWYRDGGELKPVKTDLEPALEFLLKFIHCKSKTNAKNSVDPLCAPVDEVA